jgi:hypothetical protein
VDAELAIGRFEVATVTAKLAGPDRYFANITEKDTPPDTSDEALASKKLARCQS